MTKADLMAIAERCNMEFIRNAITREGVGVWCESEELLPELDAICDSDEADIVAGERMYTQGSGYLYRIYCPTSWIDLYGWR